MSAGVPQNVQNISANPGDSIEVSDTAFSLLSINRTTIFQDDSSEHSQNIHSWFEQYLMDNEVCNAIYFI